MQCDKCGYVLQPFEDTCPRCKHLAESHCAVCGQQGIVGVCRQCHKELCRRCLPQFDGLCIRCEPDQYAVTAPESKPASATSRLAPEVQAQLARQRVSYSTGFFDSVNRAFAFIGQSMGMAFRDKDLLLPSLFAFLVNGAIIAALLLAAHYTGNMRWLLGDRAELGADYERIRLVRSILLALLAFVCYIITYFFMGMTVNLVNARLHGRDAKLGEAFADASKNAPALICLAVVSTLVSILTGMLRGRRGRDLGDLAADALQRTWTVATYLIVPVIILEDIPFSRSLGRARDLHWRNFVPIAVGEIAVSVVNGIILMLLAGIIAGAAVYARSNGQHALMIISLIIGGAVFVAAICFTEFVRTAYYTCLYLWAAEREKVGEQARVPAPLAAALAR